MSDGCSEKTVRVRIAVSVTPGGNWNAAGWAKGSEADMLGMSREVCDESGDYAETVQTYWVTAELPIPLADVPEVEGSAAPS